MLMLASILKANNINILKVVQRPVLVTLCFLITPSGTRVGEKNEKCLETGENKNCLETGENEKCVETGENEKCLKQEDKKQKMHLGSAGWPRPSADKCPNYCSIVFLHFFHSVKLT